MYKTDQEIRNIGMAASRMLGLLVFLLAWSLLAVPAQAQQQQWLGYRTSEDAWRILGKTPGQKLELITKGPEGVSLPQFVAADPIFAKWKTPMVPAGWVWVVLDRSKEGGRYDRLFIDADTDGDLSDETPVKARRSAAYGDRESARFGSVKVLLTGEDGPVAFHLNFNFWKAGSSKDTRLTAVPAGWYEGPVKIGESKYRCTLTDANANAAFDDAYPDFRQSDRITLIGTQDSVVGKAGKYIHVGEEFYGLRIARDGAYVSFSSPKKGELATLKVAKDLRTLGVGGENGAFSLRVTDGTIKLPLGKYRMDYWEMRRKDNAGVYWYLRGVVPSGSGGFEVSGKGPGKLELEFGDPIIGSVSAQKQGVVHRFGEPTLTGRNGERIALTRGGIRPPPPRLRIKNADGSYNKQVTFEYG